LPLANKVSVVGIGKLGLSLAAVLADKGYRVTGVDSNERVVNLVNAGRSPIYEPGVQNLITKNRKRLWATQKFDRVMETDVTFVVVPTPSEASGLFSLRQVNAAIEKIGAAVRSKRNYHLVVVTSTVSPGSFDSVIARSLESSSGKKLGPRLGLCYSPELIALGDVIKGLTKPDLVIIGESDSKAGNLLWRVKSSLHDSTVPTFRMNYVNAEVTKIALNSFITMKMSFANTLAELCEGLPGADVDVVTTTIGSDSRVGQKYLKGALGYGGPCFPRDNVAFAASARAAKGQAELALASHVVNLRQPSRIAKIVESNCAPRESISILGLAYKPGTNVLEASQPLMLVAELIRLGHDVYAYDPAFEEAPLAAGFGPKVQFVKDLKRCIAKAKCVVVASPFPELKSVDSSMFAKKTVIDCWRILPGRIGKVANYIAVGRYSRNTNASMLLEEGALKSLH
jgi:UDPglucose 6-dehydrogenase